jgi:hypothetical protein
MSGYMCPDRLRFPPHGEKYTPEQVIQQAIEAYMNGGRHSNEAAREPLAEFIAGELRLHGQLFSP